MLLACFGYDFGVALGLAIACAALVKAIDALLVRHR
jgi:hypothetical protein